MHKTELVKTLATLTKKEQSRFIDFLKSDYWTKGMNTTIILKMVHYIFDCIDKNKAEDLQEEHVYKHLYPNMEYSVTKNLYNRRSEALGFLKKFIVQQSLEAECSETASQNHIYAFYTKRGLDKLAIKTEKKLDKWQANIQVHWTMLDFFTSFRIALNKSTFLSLHNDGKSDVGTTYILEQLEVLYSYNYLYNCNGLLAFHNRTPFLDSTELTYHQNKAFKKNPFLESSYGKLLLAAKQIIHPNTGAAPEDYYTYKKQLLAIYKKINKSESTTLLTYARQFLVRTQVLDKNTRTQELFQLYELQFDPKNKNCPKKITANLFYAACHSALKAGQLEWTKNYIKSFEKKIFNQDFKTETVAFCKAQVLFYDNNFLEAHNCLILPQNKSENQLKYLIRILELQLLYELKADHFEAVLRSTKRFFDRSKFLNDYQEQWVSNFGNVLLRTLNTQFGIKKRYTQRLYDEIKGSKIPYIAERKWLLKITGNALNNCKDA